MQALPVSLDTPAKKALRLHSLGPAMFMVILIQVTIHLKLLMKNKQRLLTWYFLAGVYLRDSLVAADLLWLRTRWIRVAAPARTGSAYTGLEERQDKTRFGLVNLIMWRIYICCALQNLIVMIIQHILYFCVS